ncbi:cytochrome c oxidase copper chaperone [Neoarius graeffei]|uniref:cytochrome c oxidase copper chaperone n=1 Tax=Neoarius graeffei TaxID=443677 RepID=UPI00298CE65C|nr:cytochrome c oxidase copper chaperone [Neoarius graeffei]
MQFISSSRIMSSIAAATVETTNAEEKKPLKPCCACPETKKARDACIVEKGEESCTHLIEAHKACMRALGFKI